MNMTRPYLLADRSLCSVPAVKVIGNLAAKLEIQ